MLSSCKCLTTFSTASIAYCTNSKLWEF